MTQSYVVLGAYGGVGFLIRTRKTLAQNQRMATILKNVDRMTPEARTQIAIDANLIRRKLGIDRDDRGK